MSVFDLRGPVEVIAHRGYSARAPENTSSAMELAIEAGADALEFDLHVSADGTPVLFHDATLDRTTDGRGPITGATLAELDRLDAGSWFDERFRGEPIPTLARILDGVRGRVNRLYPEVKGYRTLIDVETMLQLVLDAGWLESAVFISMDWVALAHLRSCERRSLIGYIVEKASRIDDALDRAAGDSRALLDFDAELLLVDPSVAARARECDIDMAVWTVNRVEPAERLRAMGVPRITTNEVQRLSTWKSKL